LIDTFSNYLSFAGLYVSLIILSNYIVSDNKKETVTEPRMTEPRKTEHRKTERRMTEPRMTEPQIGPNLE
jgi:hypothetical protein